MFKGQSLSERMYSCTVCLCVFLWGVCVFSSVGLSVCMHVCAQDYRCSSKIWNTVKNKMFFASQFRTWNSLIKLHIWWNVSSLFYYFDTYGLKIMGEKTVRVFSRKMSAFWKVCWFLCTVLLNNLLHQCSCNGSPVCFGSGLQVIYILVSHFPLDNSP